MDLDKIAEKQKVDELSNFIKYVFETEIEPTLNRVDEKIKEFQSSQKKSAEPKKELEVIELGILDANGKKYAIKAIEL